LKKVKLEKKTFTNERVHKKQRHPFVGVRFGRRGSSIKRKRPENFE